MITVADRAVGLYGVRGAARYVLAQPVELRRDDWPRRLSRIMTIFTGQVVIYAGKIVVVLVAITAIYVGCASRIFRRSVMTLHESILVVSGRLSGTTRRNVAVIRCLRVANLAIAPGRR